MTTSWKILLHCALGLSAGMLTGCNYRFYIQKKAEWAPADVAAKVNFPNSTADSLFLDGPTQKAIDVAMNEFLPPGTKVKSPDERLTLCLSNRETYDVSVLRADELFFVTFSANLSRCGADPQLMAMDAGATYAIDARGRILDKR